MIAWIIAATGTVAALGAAVLSISRSPSDPIDPDAEKRWLVRTLADRPRLAAWVRRRLDRTKAGGLLLTIGFVVVFVLSIIAGWVFDSIDEQSGFARFDQAVAEYGASNSTPLTTAILDAVTDLGGTFLVVAVGLAVGAWGWWKYKNIHVLYFMISVIAGQALVNNGLKLIIDRERPDVLQLGYWAGSSFPSGHSAAAAALWAAVALVLGLRASSKTRALLAGGAALIAVSVAATRTLLGVHWLTDVIAGLAVGWSWFMVCAVTFGGRLMIFGEPKDEVVAESIFQHAPSIGRG